MVGAPFGSKIGEDFGWRTGMTAYACAAILGSLAIWAFYRQRSGERGQVQMHHVSSSRDGGRSAFRTPVVWALTVLVGMVGMASYSVTFFVPAAATTVFKMDAMGASVVISTGYICAIFLNLLSGYLMDHYNKWIVLSSLLALLIPASLAMTSENELIFRIATAVVLAGRICRDQSGVWACRKRAEGTRDRKCDGCVESGRRNLRLRGPPNAGCTARVDREDSAQVGT